MSKVKLFAAIPRKPELSAAQFHDHWRHPHGTMGRRISTIRKYVQSHHIPCELLNAKQTRFEGIAEVWMDRTADALALPVEPTYVADAVPDEPLFIDLPQLRFLITQEHVICSGPDHRQELSKGNSYWADDDRAVNIKIIQLLETTPPPGWAGDRPLELGLAIGALRHVCCTPDSLAYNSQSPPFFGVRELWWATVSDFQAGHDAAPNAWRELIGDGHDTITLLTQSERFK